MPFAYPQARLERVYCCQAPPRVHLQPVLQRQGHKTGGFKVDRNHQADALRSTYAG
jgi:hypothetical protein